METQFYVPITNTRYYVNELEGVLILYPNNIYEIRNENDRLIQQGEYNLITEVGDNYIEFTPIVVKKRYKVELKLV